MRRSASNANHCLDDGRASRTGIPEVVFAPSKSDRALLVSIKGLAERHDVLITKCSEKQFSMLKKAFVRKVKVADDECGGIVIKGAGAPLDPIDATVAVISAGSSDRYVAEEAALSVEYLGLRALRLYDRGVAGIHRTTGAADECQKAHAAVVIAIAGMEGTLPSVLAGLLRLPVIAVPTSVGYGTGAGGLAAMSTMLNSCAPGVLVVNIDNGFGAAAATRKFLSSAINVL